METEKSKVPVWFWIVAIIFLLWNLMGVGSFFMHTFISNDTLDALPTAEKELYESYPFWTEIVFAIAVFGGLLGSLGLILRKKWAKLAFIISIIAIIPQMVHNVFFTKAMEVYGIGQAVTMPILVVVAGLFLIWFSILGIRKHWLT